MQPGLVSASGKYCRAEQPSNRSQTVSCRLHEMPRKGAEWCQSPRALLAALFIARHCDTCVRAVIRGCCAQLPERRTAELPFPLSRPPPVVNVVISFSISRNSPSQKRVQLNSSGDGSGWGAEHLQASFWCVFLQFLPGSARNAARDKKTVTPGAGLRGAAAEVTGSVPACCLSV